MILLIEQQVSSVGCIVTESKMLKDSSGIEREIDVAIEGSVNGHAVTIALECRDHKDKDDITWIDGIIGKYRDLPVHKLVAVSRSGFTQGAVAKALANDITLLTIEAANQTDWTKELDALARIKIRSFAGPVIHRATLLVDEKHQDVFGKIDNISTLIAYRPDSSARGTMGEIVDALVSDESIRDQLLERAFSDSATEFECVVKFEKGTYICLEDGEHVLVLGLEMIGVCRKEETEAILDRGSYRGIEVAMGGFKSFGADATVVASKSENESVRIAVRLPTTIKVKLPNKPSL